MLPRALLEATFRRALGLPNCRGQSDHVLRLCIQRASSYLIGLVFPSDVRLCCVLQSRRSIPRLAATLRQALTGLKGMCTRTGRAWALKELASKLRGYAIAAWARKGWLAWAALASRSKLAPVAQSGRMVRRHLDGIVNAVVLGATNAPAESMNARIQRIKAMACRYRNRERFRNAILFHLGGLELYPRPVSAHTIS